MRSAEAHSLNDQQIIERLRDARAEAFNLRFRHATGELENTARLADSKRDVARLLTVARQREIDVDRELSKFDDEKK